MIPMSPDVQRLIGPWAEQVDNRALLYDKFALPKLWPPQSPTELNEAGRWNILRIVTRGADLLKQDAGQLQRRASRRDVGQHEKAELHRKAEIAKALANVAQPDHALIQVANANASRFLQELKNAYGSYVVTFEATLASRLMVNMAGGVIENAGIALDRCFGVPFIPGSAVKGIARAQALWEIKEANHADKPRLLTRAMLVFGFAATDIGDRGDFVWAGGLGHVKEIAKKLNTTDFKGCVCFLPAYPTTLPTLVVDMVNPHYPKYYRGARRQANDDDSPIPNYFPAVEAGSSFGFAILLNRPAPDGLEVNESDLLEHAKLWLERAVTQKGLGAKTAAGYGWFKLGRPDTPVVAGPKPELEPPATVKPVSPTDAFISKWRGKLATTGNFPAAVPELAAIADDNELRRAFEAVIPEQERKRNRKNNPYWQSFTSGRHGEAGKKILARLGFKLV